MAFEVAELSQDQRIQAKISGFDLLDDVVQVGYIRADKLEWRVLESPPKPRPRLLFIALRQPC